MRFIEAGRPDDKSTIKTGIIHSQPGEGWYTCRILFVAIRQGENEPEEKLTQLQGIIGATIRYSPFPANNRYFPSILIFPSSNDNQFPYSERFHLISRYTVSLIWQKSHCGE